MSELIELRKRVAELELELKKLQNIYEKASNALDINYKMKAAFEAGDMSWWEMHLPSGKTMFGENKVNMLGRKKEDFNSYKDFMDIVHPDDCENTMKAMRAHLYGEKKLYQSDYRIKAISGEYKWFRDIGRVIERKGEETILFGIVADVQKVKLLEEKLTNSKVQNDLILKSSTELIAYYDLDFNILWSNQSAAASVGKEVEDILGHKCYNIWRNNSEPCEGCPLLLTKKYGQKFEAEQITPDGKYWHIRSFPVLDDEGSLIGLAEFAMDISERKKALRNLTDSELKYRKILNESHLGVGVFSGGKLVESNAVFDSLFQINKQEEIFIDSIPGNILEVDKQILTRRNRSLAGFNTGQILKHSYRILSKEEGKLHIKESLKYLELNDDSLLLMTVDDISLSVNKEVSKARLIDKTISYEQKLHSLAKVEGMLRTIIFSDEDCSAKVQKILEEWQSENELQKHWDMFRDNFELLHPDFIGKLLSVAPNLTQLDIKHCAYIRMNYVTKQIATIFNVKPSSIQIARVRLKKKLNLDKDHSLYQFIMEI